MRDQNTITNGERRLEMADDFEGDKDKTNKKDKKTGK